MERTAVGWFLLIATVLNLDENPRKILNLNMKYKFHGTSKKCSKHFCKLKYASDAPPIAWISFTGIANHIDDGSKNKYIK